MKTSSFYSHWQFVLFDLTMTTCPIGEECAHNVTFDYVDYFPKGWGGCSWFQLENVVDLRNNLLKCENLFDWTLTNVMIHNLIDLIERFVVKHLTRSQFLTFFKRKLILFPYSFVGYLGCLFIGISACLFVSLPCLFTIYVQGVSLFVCFVLFLSKHKLILFARSFIAYVGLFCFFDFSSFH